MAFVLSALLYAGYLEYIPGGLWDLVLAHPWTSFLIPGKIWSMEKVLFKEPEGFTESWYTLTATMFLLKEMLSQHPCSGSALWLPQKPGQNRLGAAANGTVQHHRFLSGSNEAKISSPHGRWLLMCWNIAAAAVSSLLVILTSSSHMGRTGSWENTLVGLKFFRTGREKRTGFVKWLSFPKTRHCYLVSQLQWFNPVPCVL